MSEEQRVRFSVIIPIYNEEPNLYPLYTRLTKVMQGLGGGYEIIFIDDGSTDNTFQILKDLHQKDSRVKVIRFTRNFGQHIALTAGLDYCTGELVIRMDADLQDKPEEIPKLLAKLNEGYDIVYGSRKKRQDVFLKKLGSSIYHWLRAKLTNQVINSRITPMQIMTRRVVDYTNQFRERSRSHGGLVAWLGFSYGTVDIEHDRRFAGKTKYNLRKLIKLAIEGVISFSDTPLQVIGFFGFVVSAISFIVGIYYLSIWLIWHTPMPGYTSIIVSLFFLGGVQLIVLGVIGQYIGRIHIEVKQRPLYVVRDRLEGKEDNA